MGFLGFGKPKWRHGDPKVRRAAVRDLEPHHERTLVKVAIGDSDAGIRTLAAAKVVSAGALRELAQSGDDSVKQIARERLSGVAAALAMERPFAECAPYLEQIDERKALAEITLGARDVAVREASFARLCAQPEASQAMLALIAVQDGDGRFGQRAVTLIDKRSSLKDIVRKAKSEAVRTAAQARLAVLDAEAKAPSNESRRKARAAELEQVCVRAAQLAVSSDFQAAADGLAELGRRWDAILAEFDGLAVDAAVDQQAVRLKRAHANFAARKSAARERDELMAQQALLRSAFLDRLAAVPSGSLDEPARLRLLEEWRAFGELPADARESAARIGRELARVASDPYATVEAEAPKAPRRELTEAQRTELETLLAESETLSPGSDWRKADDRFRILHKRWSDLTVDLENNDPGRQRFLAAYAGFKEARRAQRELRDGDHRQRLDEMQDLASRAEQLAKSVPDEAGLREHGDRLKELQAAWKRVGPVRAALAAPLRARFRAACDAAFEPLRSLREAEDWDRFANLAKAEELAARVEAAQAISDLPALANEIKRAQAAWKHVGPLPQNRQQDLWLRFKTACDTQYERCKVYFAEKDAERAANLEAKRAIIAEVEQMAARGTIGLVGSPADIAAKQAAMERIKQIQLRWRDIGPVPREHDQEMWNRFRTLCDGFFVESKALRAREQAENLERKYAMCAAVEQMADSAQAISSGAIAADKQRWLKQVKEYQFQWKEIGHVPMDQKEVVWTRFRTACDRIYDLVKDQLAILDSQRAENLVKKQALLAEVEAIVAAPEPGAQRERVKQLQQQWKEIGHVPRDVSDDLFHKWQETCDKVFR